MKKKTLKGVIPNPTKSASGGGMKAVIRKLKHDRGRSSDSSLARSLHGGFAERKNMRAPSTPKRNMQMRSQRQK